MALPSSTPWSDRSWPRVPCSYVLPLKATDADPDLDAYLGALTDAVDEVIVVESSADDVFAAHEARWPDGVRHLRPSVTTPMGKVGNVVTGLRAATNDVVVLADDDVRWTHELLQRAVDAMDTAQVARPQNVFRPTPWHARWDTGRVLIHRALDGDWPGTLVVRRSALPFGYAGDALFENLELVRTVRASGGRERVLLDVVVPRRPPTARKFLEQRVRQAYDEWARPAHLVAQLLVLPSILRWRGRALVALMGGSVLLAERGRRRAGGREHWPPSASWWAGAWALERAITSWCAVGVRLLGGARFAGRRLPLAAHSLGHLRRTAEEH